MPIFRRLMALSLLTTLLATPLAASPASAEDDGGNHTAYSQEWRNARETGAPHGAPPSWGTVDPNGNNPAGFYTFEPHFSSVNGRLENRQTGDKGLHWAVAGPKDFRERRIYNWSSDETRAAEYGTDPTAAKNQYTRMTDDLQAACLNGNWPERCWTTSDGFHGEIHWSYFQYETRDYRLDGLGRVPHSSWAWVVYLQDDNGGLSWGGNEFSPMGAPPYNYGKVATIGEIRKFLLSEYNEGTNGGRSETYNYNMARALLYLDYVYGDDDEHPIEFLAIPSNWHYICLTPDTNADGSVYRDNYGDLRYQPTMPLTYNSEWSRNNVQRIMECPPITEGRWEYAYESEIRGTSTQTLIDIEAPYALWTEVSDDSPTGVGRRQFTTQSEHRLTPFGQLVNRLCEERGGCESGTAFTESELRDLEAAANSSDNATAPRVDLTPGNQAALAEGRLVLVAEHAQDARITLRTQRDRYMRRWSETRTYYNYDGTILSSSFHQSPWEYANQPERDIEVGESSFLFGQRHFTGGYQALTTHCNQGGFDSTVGASSIDERETSNPTFTGTYLAGSAVSPVFTDPAAKPWGVNGPTSELGFYDKVCSFQGTRTDAETERPSTAQLPSYLTEFRANQWEELPVAYYTPTSEGWVDYKQDGPVGFTATRWAGGTPVPGQFWLGGRDCESGAMSGGYFGTETGTAPTLRQWVHQDFSNETVAVGVGCYKRIFTRGVWASLNRKPQVMTVKWDFMPDIDTVIPATNIGLTQDRRATYDKATVGARVRGQVVSSHEVGRSVVDAHQQVWEDATGTGSTNTLDVPTPYGTALDSSGAWTVQPDLFDAHYYAVKLVRAVGQ